MILAIDPGVHACGAALFRPDGRLHAAEYVRIATVGRAAGEVRGFVMRANLGHSDVPLLIEKPRIYPGPDQRKGDLNDLIDLAEVVGALRATFHTEKVFYPSDWKGQVPKAVMTARIEDTLTPEERSRIVRVGAKDHNTLDAVGIGLFHFGRLNQRKHFR